jgi:hypothetical protein
MVPVHVPILQVPPSHGPQPSQPPSRRRFGAPSSVPLSVYVISGVRPSPNTEAPNPNSAIKPFTAIDLKGVAAAEDGRTPLHRYLPALSAIARSATADGRGKPGECHRKPNRASVSSALQIAPRRRRDGITPARPNAHSTCPLSQWERVRVRGKAPASNASQTRSRPTHPNPVVLRRNVIRVAQYR